jgi:hypothetical protein
VVAFIKKADQMTFQVGSSEVDPKDFRCERLIEDFERRLEAGEVDLTSVYPRMSNEALARVPGIAAMLHLKGIDVGAGNQG